MYVTGTFTLLCTSSMTGAHNRSATLVAPGYDHVTYPTTLRKPSPLLFDFTGDKLALASHPGLLTPAFVACSTNVGEGLVKLSHVQ